jgi:hypothetical protein
MAQVRRDRLVARRLQAKLDAAKRARMLALEERASAGLSQWRWRF